MIFKYKNLLTLFIFSFLVCPINFTGAESIDEKTYKTLKEELKTNPENFDYSKFRKSYTKTEFYLPYTGGSKILRHKLYGVINNADYKSCLSIADEWLISDYTSVDAHFGKHICCEQLKESECANFHGNITRGLFDSILMSGDGITPETAYITFNFNEIYFFMQMYKLELKEQSLESVNGRIYDVMKVIHSESKEEHVIYFDITVQMTNPNDPI